MADTPKSYFEEKIANKVKTSSPEEREKINAIYEFNITGDNGGVWTVTILKDAGTVEAGSKGNAKCTVTASSAYFMNIVAGKMNAQMAFMSGKLKIKGDMGLAMKLQKVMS